MTAGEVRALLGEPSRWGDPRVVHRAKAELLETVRSSLPPFAQRLLPLVQRYLDGEAVEHELREGRADVWAHLGTLACYCTVDESASLRSVLSALESEVGAHDEASLEGFLRDLALVGASTEALGAALERASSGGSGG